MRDKRRKRPVSVGRFNFRINENDKEMLQYLHDKTGRNLSTIIRDALKAEYNLERFKDEDDEVQEKKEVLKEPEYDDYDDYFDDDYEDDDDDFE